MKKEFRRLVDVVLTMKGKNQDTGNDNRENKPEPTCQINTTFDTGPDKFDPSHDCTYNGFSQETIKQCTEDNKVEVIETEQTKDINSQFDYITRFDKEMSDLQVINRPVGSPKRSVTLHIYDLWRRRDKDIIQMFKQLCEGTYKFGKNRRPKEDGIWHKGVCPIFAIYLVYLKIDRRITMKSLMNSYNQLTQKPSFREHF